MEKSHKVLTTVEIGIVILSPDVHDIRVLPEPPNDSSLSGSARGLLVVLTKVQLALSFPGNFQSRPLPGTATQQQRAPARFLDRLHVTSSLEVPGNQGIILALWCQTSIVLRQRHMF